MVSGCGRETMLRVIDDPELDGAWNMAVDQALLQCADEGGQVTLRFYRWAPATLSLGYFQKADDLKTHPLGFNCPVVRRASGGGAILHDRELTYSLCLPSHQRWATENERFYQMVHGAIIEFLASRKIVAEIHDAPTHETHHQAHSAPPFLCFERRTRGDVVIDAYKILGSAQRRQKKALLQHGSLLLESSPYTPHLPGIFDLTANRFPQAEIVEFLVSRISSGLELPACPGLMSERERHLARMIVAQRFGNDQWTYHR